MKSQSDRVVIVTEYIGSQNSTAYYWAKIALYLADHYELLIICPKTVHTERFRDDSGLKFLFCSDVGSGNNVFRKLFALLYTSFTLNIRLAKSVKSTDLVFSGTNPMASLLLTAVIKAFKKFKWMVLCHDIFPDNLLPAQLLKPGFVFNVLNRIFSRIYTKADMVAPIGRDMARKLREKGVPEERIKVISNWVDTNHIFLEPKQDNRIIKELGWENEVVFNFFGNLGRLQGLDNLLAAILLVKNKRARFLFIGRGAQERSLANFINDNPIGNVCYYGALDLSENNTGLNAGDVALVTLSEGMWGLGVPSKAYFSMAADKPILYVGDAGSELQLLVKEREVGWFCEGGSPEKLALRIDRICLEFESGHAIPRPRNLMINNFSPECSIHGYCELIDRLFELNFATNW